MSSNQREMRNTMLGQVHQYDVNPVSREIYLWDATDIDTAVKFAKNLRILEMSSHDPIIIHTYNEGGCWNAGMMMYDAIRQCQLPMFFVCHGMAGSMGSIIPQAVHGFTNCTRLSMPNCEWLVHQGDLSNGGEYQQVVEAMRQNTAIGKQMIDLYTDVMVDAPVFEDKTRAYVKRFLTNKLEKKTDWWLFADDAVKYGLCDAVLHAPLSHVLRTRGLAFGPWKV